MVKFRGKSFNSSRLLLLVMTASITAQLGIYTPATAATSDLPLQEALPLTQDTPTTGDAPVPPETQPAPDTSVENLPKPNSPSNTQQDEGKNQELLSQKSKVSKRTIIKATYRGADKLTLVPGQPILLNLLITEDIKTSQGEVLIPKNSEIQGQLVSLYDDSTLIGVQFLSERLIIGNRLYNNINVTSPILTDSRPTTYNFGGFGEAAAISAAEVLLGKMGGYRIDPVPIVTRIIRNRPTRNPRDNQSIVIDMKKTLPLTFNEDFYLN